MAERAEPELPGTVTLTVSRAAFERLRSLAARWGIPVELALARLTGAALRGGRPAPSVAGAVPLAGLSTDGLDPDEDAYWRELYELSGEAPRDSGAPGGVREPAATQPDSAPPR